MVPGWIAVWLAFALVAGQSVIDEPHRRLPDEQSSLSALDHAPLPASRVQRGVDIRSDARRAVHRTSAVLPELHDAPAAREVALVAPRRRALTPRVSPRTQSAARAPPPG